MSFEKFKKHSEKEYLGYCDTIQSWLYSLYLGDGNYAIVAIKDSECTILITFEGKRKEEMQDGNQNIVRAI
jgi:hypothetical protein